MKPLQAVGMGLVVVALTAPVHGFDLLANPLGWALLLHGLVRLPALPWGAAARFLAGLALAVSVVLWYPGVVDALTRADESLVWAADLPQATAVAVLCIGLARLAEDAGDRAARAWLRTAGTLSVATGVLPVVVYGALGTGEALMLVLATLALLLVIVLAFRYAGRPWAGAGHAKGPSLPEEERPLS